jgi:hypothetical protein
VEDRVLDARQGAPAGAVGLDRREIAIRPPLRFMAHVPLFLERLERRQHGGIRQRLVELALHLRDRGGAKAPEDAHHLELARGKIDVGHVNLGRENGAQQTQKGCSLLLLP